MMKIPKGPSANNVTGPASPGEGTTLSTCSRKGPKMVNLPKSIAERYAAMPTTPEEATWQCDTCGVIEPKGYEVNGVVRYHRRLCPCREAERERQKKEEEHAVWQENQAKQIYSWLGPRWTNTTLRKKTFENFDVERQPEAYKFSRLFASKPIGALILHGTYGTGKTHLLAAMCNEALWKHNRTSLFTTAPGLFAAIQQRISEDNDYYALVERAAKTPLLVIDDIDKAKPSEFREEIYFAILDERVKRELPTAISVNQIDELGSFVGGAVCSRLKAGQIAIAMSGRDYREEL